MGATPKFYKRNKINGECTFTFTSASTELKSFLYDRSRNTRLYSVSSNDSTPEVWDIQFSETVAIDAILVDNHNIKSGGITYWNGSAFVAFPTAISWSANSSETSFFNFTQVLTTKIRITMNTTMVANSQKFIGEIYVLEYLGTTSEGPVSLGRTIIEDQRKYQAVGGGSRYVLFGQKMVLDYKFNSATNADIALFQTLKDLREEFFVYPCGGEPETDIGLRLKDIYLMNFTSEIAPEFKSNVIGIGTIISTRFEET